MRCRQKEGAGADGKMRKAAEGKTAPHMPAGWIPELCRKTDGNARPFDPQRGGVKAGLSGIAGCSMSVSALKFQSDRVPGISVSRPCVRSRYWLGVIPVFFLKAMLKCDAYSNPLSNAIS